MNFFIYSIVSKILVITVPLLLGIAFLTLAERKVMASMQRRKGPNVVGIFGLFISEKLNEKLKTFFDGFTEKFLAARWDWDYTLMGGLATQG